MAVLEAEFESKTLQRVVSFRAILPLEKFQSPYPTLYLLHGLSGNSSRWLHYTNMVILLREARTTRDPIMQARPARAKTP